MFPVYILCTSVVFCLTCHQCLDCCSKCACRARVNLLWSALWASFKVITILMKGNTLPFRNQPTLTRLQITCTSLRNINLMQVLHGLIQKNSVEKVTNQISLAIFNRLFLVPKSNNKWSPILDLNSLNNTGICRT